MRHGRDDFSQGVKTILAHRAGYRCSKPSCRALTVGPSDEHVSASSNIGVAAHISAASEGGPRFDSRMDPETRRSVTNGIWLCQTHAKEVDDDERRFTRDLLVAWKAAAEGDARAMLGVPISELALEVRAEVVLHRGDGDGLIAIASTNLPDGTRVWVDLYQCRSERISDHREATVVEGTIAVSGLRDEDLPFAHGWHRVELLSYFNGPWQQPPHVIGIVGDEGAKLAGRLVKSLHPELAESEKIFHATFDCVAPTLNGTPALTDDDLARAIAIVKETTLTIDRSESSSPVGDVVELFMKSPDLRVHDGWRSRQLPNGAVVVTYSFWNGSTPASSSWLVILHTREVRYSNLYGKLMSWSPAD